MVAELLPYLGIAASLMAAGSVVPFPEEIILLSLGYGVSTHVLHMLPALLVAAAGILLGDSILFGIAKKGGVFADLMYARLTRSRVGVLVEHRDRYPGYMVVITRFIIGVRSFGPFIAVTQGMHWWRFFLWDIVAVSIYVPLWFFIGFHFHHSFLRFIHDLHILHGVVFALFLAFVGACALWFTYGSVKR